MSDPLAELRAAVTQFLAESDRVEASAVRPGMDPFDDVIVAFFRTEPRSDTFEVSLLELTGRDEDLDIHPGRAAAWAAKTQPARSITVEQALHFPSNAARAALFRALGLNQDAADSYLERPAAVLAQRSPDQIRHLAALVRRPVAELYRDITESWRSSAGFAYAYRPGEAVTEPAEVLEGAGLGPLIDWGADLLSPDPAAAS